MSNIGRAVYILKLESGKWYIGSLSLTMKHPEVSTHPRILQHFLGSGSEWTKLHFPIELETFITPADEFEENKQTKKYMIKYGIDNVRGGSYCEINLPDDQLSCLRKEMATSGNLCFRCNLPGHYSKNCRTIICYKCGQIGHISPRCPM